MAFKVYTTLSKYPELEPNPERNFSGITEEALFA